MGEEDVQKRNLVVKRDKGINRGRVFAQTCDEWKGRDRNIEGETS